MKKVLFIAFLAPLLCLSACDNGLSSNNANSEIQTSFKYPNLKITNASNHDICLFVVGEELSTRIDWIPIWNEENKLKPQESRTVVVSPDLQNAWYVHWWDTKLAVHRLEITP